MTALRSEADLYFSLSERPGDFRFQPEAAVQFLRKETASSLQEYLDLAAFFLAFFAAFRSFGVIVGCFLPSFVGLRSFDILFASPPLHVSDASFCIVTVNRRLLSASNRRSTGTSEYPIDTSAVPLEPGTRQIGSHRTRTGIALRTAEDPP